jgi:hypothetical protein
MVAHFERERSSSNNTHPSASNYNNTPNNTGALAIQHCISLRFCSPSSYPVTQKVQDGDCICSRRRAQLGTRQLGERPWKSVLVGVRINVSVRESSDQGISWYSASCWVSIAMEIYIYASGVERNNGASHSQYLCLCLAIAWCVYYYKAFGAKLLHIHH